MKMETFDNRRWWALGAIMLAVLAVGLDITVLSVALPTLATGLHAAESELQWFSAGYALALAAAMLPAGVLGDRFGRKKVMMTSLVMFGLGSAACSYAANPGMFIIARIILGAAGAGLTVTALSVITVIFSEEERPRAVGLWAAANFLAMPIGPILGGWLLSHFWWGWVFLMNVPVVIIGIIAVLVAVPESRDPAKPGLDPLGMFLVSGGTAIVVYGLIEAGVKGWNDPGSLGSLAGGVAALVMFCLWERFLGGRPHGQPLVDLSLFRSAAFAWGSILAAVGLLAMVGVMFTVPQYFQAILGFDAQGSGFSLLPLIGGLMLGAIPANRVVAAIGPKLTTACGFALMAAGLAVGSTTTASSPGIFTLAWLTVFGLGIGLALTTAASTALVVLPAERAGIGSAIMSAMQKLGAPLGAAILGSLLSSAYIANLALTGVPEAAAVVVRSSVFGGLAVARELGSASIAREVEIAFMRGMDIALLVSAGLAVAGLILALLFIPARMPRTNEHDQDTTTLREGNDVGAGG
ncbi:MFS transporter [Arthrobacter bambusae]|uniref:MFS transporter n=1 Tax=Arthrobacter bambusae TaxID=1338426 RepID=UPI00277F90B2|nr:MFS transporter [Arthrobacter bambusae]MDQ0028570.1 EmrB/QacA subfamily drug resistance transporter [Arthrobacter bambusae]MDQ0096636.1 EmrB/QacA subfamily drug resistance transporter [Arthrobacter bambusae]